MNKLLISILLTLIVAILLVAIILQPENVTFAYWGSVLWIILLVSANWVASAAIITGVEKYSDGTPGSYIGALPAINILLFVFSIFSILLLIGFNMSVLSSKVHLVIQIILVAIFSVIILLTGIAAKGAGHGMTSDYTKRDFLEICRNLEKRETDPSLQDELKKTINHISFKMKHPAKHNQDDLKIIFAELKDISRSQDSKKLSKILEDIRVL